MLRQRLPAGDPAFAAVDVLAVGALTGPGADGGFDRAVAAAEPRLLTEGLVHTFGVILEALAVGNGRSALLQLNVLQDSVDRDHGGHPARSPLSAPLRSQTPLPPVKSVIGIPGPWMSRRAVQAGLLPAFAFAGDVMLRVEDNQAATLDVEERLERLGSTFRIGGRPHG